MWWIRHGQFQTASKVAECNRADTSPLEARRSCASGQSCFHQLRNGASGLCGGALACWKPLPVNAQRVGLASRQDRFGERWRWLFWANRNRVMVRVFATTDAHRRRAAKLMPAVIRRLRFIFLNDRYPWLRAVCAADADGPGQGAHGISDGRVRDEPARARRAFKLNQKLFCMSDRQT